ncbi:hypothetical protein BDV59DRAFT_120674 [Aspergillus ambiguus]|uniref:uncharacterized protein n=1 Tax=Aspergillus ambiguus TaxID=176160 RepID=UPI003CCDA9E1
MTPCASLPGPPSRPGAIAPRTSWGLEVPRGRKWFIADIRVDHQETYYQIRVWASEEEWRKLSCLGAVVITRRKLRARWRYELELWLHKDNVPHEKVQLFEAGIERMQSLRSRREYFIPHQVSQSEGKRPDRDPCDGDIVSPRANRNN